MISSRPITAAERDRMVEALRDEFETWLNEGGHPNVALFDWKVAAENVIRATTRGPNDLMPRTDDVARVLAHAYRCESCKRLWQERPTAHNRKHRREPCDGLVIEVLIIAATERGTYDLPA